MDDYDRNTRPITPLGYIGFEILYALPVIGLVLAIIFAITAKNRNVKNFAIAQLIAIVIAVILVMIAMAVGMASGLTPDEVARQIQQA